MANAWFRMYSEFRNDPKIRTMSDSLQIRLVRLMCLRCDSPTDDLTPDEIKFGIGCNDDETFLETKRVFLKKEFIDENWDILNWNKRQFISDSSTERVRKHRANRTEKHSETLHETHETRNVTDQNRTDTEQIRTDKTLSRGKRSKREPSPDGMKHSKDPRHIACKEAVRAYWKSKNQDEMPWDGREGRALGMLLGASPDLTPERVTQLLRHRYGSEVNHSDRPGKWIPSLLSYASGPIDRFGHPMDVKSGKDAPRAQPGYSGEVAAEKVDESKKFFLDRARERQSRGDPLNQLDKEMLREVKELRV